MRNIDTLNGKRWRGALAAAVLGAAAAAVLSLPSLVVSDVYGASRFPNVPLVTQDGRTVHFYDDLIKGKSVVINVIYTHCKEKCPLETAKLAQVQRLLADHIGKDLFFYSISIDPEWDTPAVLKAYAEKFHIGPGWLLLTGRPEDVTAAQKAVGLYSATDAMNPDGHLPSLMIGNEPTGQWMLNSAVDNPRFLARTISNFLIGYSKGLAASKPATTYATAKDIPGFSAGSYLFETKCSACHTIGSGDRLGPDLIEVTSTRSPIWLRRFIMHPDEMIDGGDPIATTLFAKYQQLRMPNLRLADGDVEVILSYVAAQSAAIRDHKASVAERPEGRSNRPPSPDPATGKSRSQK